MKSCSFFYVSDFDVFTLKCAVLIAGFSRALNNVGLQACVCGLFSSENLLLGAVKELNISDLSRMYLKPLWIVRK